MRIEQLQAFLAIAETGNFGQAAQKCGVTQSTISRQIQSLESILGLSLFHRTTQAKLTLGGEHLLPRARKICKEWETALEECSNLLEGKQPELCIAGIHSVCSYYLPWILPKFCQKYPEVQLRVTALGSDRALKVLKDGLVDVAIVMNNRFLTATPEMVVDLLYEDSIEVLMSANHPLAECQEIQPLQLGDYAHILFKDGYGMQRLVQEWLLGQKVNFRVAMELNSLDAFRGVVRNSDMIALLPHSALAEARHDSTLAVRRLEVANPLDYQSLSRQVVMVTTSDRLQIPPIANFCNLVRELATHLPSKLVT
jgi:DNA-binding transcriptional LysR family regulator